MLAAYKEEYEATPGLTIEALIAKYSLNPEDIKGHKTWKKRQVTPLVTTRTLPPRLTPKVVVDSSLTTTEKIEKFKEQALDHALNFMSNDAKFAEVKEFKDIVAIVDSIEKSYKGTQDTGPTINILVQNLMERFNDDV